MSEGDLEIEEIEEIEEGATVRSRSRKRPYQPPRVQRRDEDKRTTFELDLLSSEAQDSAFKGKGPTRRGTTDRLQDQAHKARQYRCESIETYNVVKSQRAVHEDGHESAILHAERNGSADAACHFRWIHMHCKKRTLEDFEHFASRLDHINDDDRAMVVALLKKVKRFREKSWLTGRYLEPVVRRCEGRGQDELETKERWAIFLCFPYLKPYKAAEGQSIQESQFHLTRTLLSTFYQMDLTKERDIDQVARQSPKLAANEFLHVPQLWALLLSCGTIVTSSPDSLSETLGPSIELEDRPSLQKGRTMRVIRFTDQSQRIFFFPIEQCKTWFSFMAKVMDVCGTESEISPGDYKVYKSNGAEVQAAGWQAFLANSKDDFINLSAQLQTPTTPSPPSHLLEKGRTEDEISNAGSSAESTIGSSDSSSILSNDDHDPSEFSGFSYRDKSSTDPSPRGRAPLDESSIPQMGPLHHTSRNPLLTDDVDEKHSPAKWAVVKRQMTKDRLDQPLANEIDASHTSRPSPRRIDRYPKERTFSQKAATVRKASRESIRPANRELVLSSDRHKVIPRPRHYHLGDGPPQSRISMQPQRPISGAVINVVSPGDEDPVIYYRLSQQDAPQPEDQAKVTNQHIFDPVEETPQSDSADAKMPELADKRRAGAPSNLPAFPPVFTWEISRSKKSPLPATKTASSVLSDSEGTASEQEALGRPRIESPCSTGEQQEAAYQVSKEGKEITEALLKRIDIELREAKEWSVEILGEEGRLERSLYRQLPLSSQATTKTMCEVLTSDSTVSGRDNAVKTRWPHALKAIFDDLQGLFEFFIPLSSQSHVSKKYWGAVRSFLQNSHRLCSTKIGVWREENGINIRYANKHAADRYHGAAKYVVVDQSNGELRVCAGNMTDLRNPFQSCETCQEGHEYDTLADAVRHLVGHPYPEQLAEMAKWEPDVERWVVKVTDLPFHMLQMDCEKLLKTVKDHCYHLRKQQQEIRQGVCKDGIFDFATYMLPLGLVTAFKRILMLVTYSAYMASVAYKNFKEWSLVSVATSYIDPDHKQHLIVLGYGAEGALDDAKSHLILMSRTGDYSHGIGYEAVGPEYVVSLLLGDLCGRTNGVEALHLLNFYQLHSSSLRFRSVHRPSKRLLHDINIFEEEVGILSDIMGDQWAKVMDYKDVIAPESFRVTSHSRMSLYDLEHFLLDRIARQLRGELDQYFKLGDSAPQLAKTTKERVEVQQEDHGKAILVFTIVTITFLPLSFVSSLFGMNTSDIRSLQSGQWLFWAVALPLTVSVVALASFIGYRGERIRETLSRVKTQQRSRVLVPAKLADAEARLETSSTTSFDTSVMSASSTRTKWNFWVKKKDDEVITARRRQRIRTFDHRDLEEGDVAAASNLHRERS